MSKTELPTGHIVKIREMTANYMIVELSNGVHVSISFNPGYVHLNFGFLDKQTGLGVEEAKWLGTPINLSNYISVTYTPKKDV